MRTARSKAWSSSRNVRGEEIWYGRFEVITSNRGQSTRRASPWITSTGRSAGPSTAVTVYVPEERPSAENEKDWLDPLLASTTLVWNVRTALPAESARVTVSVSSKTTASTSLPRSTSPAIERLDPCDVADNLAIQYPRVPIDSSST